MRHLNGSRVGGCDTDGPPMPTEDVRREHHGHWRERGERRAASLNHGRWAYGHDSHGEAGEDGPAGSMAKSGIRVGAAPGGDGEANNGGIAGANEPVAEDDE